MPRHILTAIALVLIAAALVAAAGFWWVSRSGLPLRSGEAVIEGLVAPVQVRWSEYGVPHLSGASFIDLAAALGYLHANDRFTQMELGRRLSGGRLAEVVGDVALPSDRYFLGLGFRRWARLHYESLETETKTLLESYADGVNAWLRERGSDLPPELRILGITPEPWTPVDSLYFQLQLTHSLSFWQGRPEERRFQWLRAIGHERLENLLGGDPLWVAPSILEMAGLDAPALEPSSHPAGSVGGATIAPAPRVLGLDRGNLGSNNWALGSSRTESGIPILANDPHLPLALPGYWYQALLRAPDYEAAGMTLPGFPFVVIGQGPNVAWGFTNVMLDDHDLFIEQLSDDGESVLRDGSWTPVESETLEIPRRDGDSETFVLRITDLGVLLPADEARGLPPRSLAWTGAIPGDPGTAFVRVARAGSVDELIGNLEAHISPAQNLVAADRAGGLLYTAIGRVPRRPLGDGRIPAPAWDTAYHWDGLMPQVGNPTRLRPADDLLVTANNDIRVEDGPPPPTPFTADFDTPHRADRIRELLLRRERWLLPQIRTVQNDVVSLYAREVIDAIDGDYAGDAGTAYGVLSEWDGAMLLQGPAALFALTERELISGAFGDEASTYDLPSVGGRGPLLRLLHGELAPEWYDDVSTPQREERQDIIAAALQRAWEQTERRWGSQPSTWDYGELHPLSLDNPLGSLPVIGSWFNRGPLPMPGSATTVAAFGGGWSGDIRPIAYGPSMRWIADPNNGDNTLAVLPAGQSGHPADAHYDDQLPLYLAGELHPVYWSDAAIEANTVSRLTLVPSTGSE